MSYTKRIKESVLYILFFTAIGSVAAILFRSVLARYLQPHEYGLFYSVFGFVMLLNSFRDFGISAALPKFIPEWVVQKKYDLINQGINGALRVQLIYVMVLSCVIYVFSGYLTTAYFKTTVAQEIIVVMLVLLIAEAFFNTWINTFIGFQASGISTSMNAMRMVLVIGISWVLLEVNFGIQNAVLVPAYAYVLATTLCSVGYYVLLKKKHAPSYYLFTQKTREATTILFQYGIYFFFTSISGLVLSYTDTIMITYFMTVTDVGYYNAALPIVAAFMSVGSLLLMIILPLASELYAARKMDVLKKGVHVLYKYFFLLCLPLFGLCVLFAREIIMVFFGAAYLPAVIVLQVLMIGALFFIFSSLNYGVLSGIGEVKKQTKTFVFVALINVVLNMFLIPRYGIAGAVATTISYCIGFIMSAYHMYTLFAIRYECIWLKNTIIFLVSAFVTYMITQTQLGFSTIVTKVIAASSGLIIYCVLCIIVKLVEKKDFHEFLLFVKK